MTRTRRPHDTTPQQAAVRPSPGALLALAATLLSGWLLMGPVLGAMTTQVLGAYDSEAGWHIWRHAAYLRTFADPSPWIHLPEHGARNPGAANLFPGSTLLSWPFYALAGGGLRGVALSWNALHLLALLGGALGTWASVRLWLAEDPGRFAAGAATAIVAAGAYLQEFPDVGRLETLHQLLYPLHLAALLWTTQRPRQLLPLLACTASFALMAMQGGFPALFLAIIEPPVALWCLVRSDDRRWSAVALGLTAGAGALALWPWIDAHQTWPSPALQGREGEISVALAQLLPGGRDIPFPRGYHVTPYPGVVALAAATAAALRDRSSRVWLLIAILAGCFAVGPELRWTPSGPLWATGPVGLLRDAFDWPIPSTGWSRIGTWFPTLLAMAAAPLLVGRPRVAVALALGACVDQLSFAPAWRHTEAAWVLPPAQELRPLLDEHTVWVPFDDRSLTWIQTREDPALRRYPIQESMELGTLRYLDRLVPGHASGFRGLARRGPVPPPPSPACVVQDLRALSASGYAWLAFVGDRVDDDTLSKATQPILAGVGEPTLRSARGMAWRLSGDWPDMGVCTESRPQPQRPPRHPPGGR
ncbi:MAG: hypothetical protein H6739_13615 [Alphaproteobacteria bacterium]|nr:hypothetical protein [Alphaproteobacteria bacterium]